MKVNKRNEIIEASIAELRREWKTNEYDQLYTFEQYFNIMTQHNKVKLVESTDTTPPSNK